MFEIIPRLTIAETLYAVVGTELNIWYDSIVLDKDNGLINLSNYAVEIVCSVGVQKQRCYSINATAGQTGSKSMTVSVYNTNGDLLVAKTVTLVVLASAAAVGGNILMLGDSITAEGSITATILSKYVSAGGTTPVFVGQFGDGDAKHQAVAGWKYGNYLNSSSPFYNSGTGSIDIAYYRSSIGLSGLIDIVTMQLGVNEALGTVTSQTLIDIVNNIKALCTAFVADNANTKMIVVLPTSDGNTKDGWGVNYGATKSKMTYQKNIYSIREAIISAFDKSVYAANVMVSSAGCNLDRYYGYELTDSDISQRYAVTEKTHVNAVHPTVSGYQQIADGIYASLRNLT